MTWRPSTQREALAAALYSGDTAHPFDPECGCALCYVALREAERLEEKLTEVGWHVAPDVSLPESAPKGDPATAVASIDDLPDRQWCVWWAIYLYGPCTDEELVERYESAQANGSLDEDDVPNGTVAPKQTPQSIRSRRAELARAGHVWRTGQRRPTKNGGTAAVWTARGTQAVAA